MLSNQHPSIFFTYLACYFYVSKEDGKRKYIIMGMLLAIANILRPDAIIFWISLMGVVILCILKNYQNNKAEIKRNVLNLIIFFVIYFSMLFLSSIIVKGFGLNDIGLNSNSGYWNIVVGLNKETAGTWNEKDAILITDYQKNYSFSKEQAQIKLVED